MRYTYGMRARGFSPLCQPKEGLVEHWDSPYHEYYDLLEYNRKLTPEEEREYELDYLGEENDDAVLGACNHYAGSR